MLLGKRRRKEAEFQAAMRAAVDLPLLEVMRDGLLRGSEASALRWRDLEFHADGSGRLHVLRSKTDQTAEGTVLYLGPAAVDALLAIRPDEAMIDPGASVFGLSARHLPEDQGGDQDGGPGRRVQRPLAQGGHGPRSERSGGGVAGADDRGKVGQPHHAGQVHRGPGRRQGSGRPVSPGRPTAMNLKCTCRGNNRAILLFAQDGYAAVTE